jgi:hypothetical protein
MIRALYLVLAASLLLAPQATNGWSLPMTRREAFGTATTASSQLSTMIMVAWVLPALADEDEPNTTNKTTDTDEERQAAVLRRMKERRQLMEASRSSNSRQSYLDLSRQRAALYNTTSKAVSCPPNVPCL